MAPPLFGYCGMSGDANDNADCNEFLLLAQDREFYMAHVLVREDFGCILHEAKD